MIQHETTLRVRYAETDAQGIVHHSVYLVWFEVGRVELLRARGVNNREMEALGYDLIVTETHARYLAPARFDDRILLQTALAGLRSRIFAFQYEVRLVDGPLLVQGHTSHLILDRSTGRPVRVPEDVARLFR